MCVHNYIAFDWSKRRGHHAKLYFCVYAAFHNQQNTFLVRYDKPFILDSRTPELDEGIEDAAGSI